MPVDPEAEEVHLTVVVEVDRTSPDWREARADVGDQATTADVLEAEVLSHLESVPYVRHVVVTPH